MRERGSGSLGKRRDWRKGGQQVLLGALVADSSLRAELGGTITKHQELFVSPVEGTQGLHKLEKNQENATDN